MLTDEEGSFDEILNFYQEFIDQDPYNANAWYNLGVVYNRLGKFEDAIAAYDYALLIDDTFSSAYFNLGNALMNTNQYEKALEAYLNTINCEGSNAENCCYLAASYEKLDQIDMAFKYFKNPLSWIQNMMMRGLG